jgi:organic hydroperoxide reductase OsmC/OhrA
MHGHHATIDWQRREPDFLRGRYSREHTWTFDGGVTVPASPSPSVVPQPWSNPANVDPEEAFVAAVSSCHMLTFLWLAAKAGYVVDCYRDEAVGVMTKNENGVPWVSTVTLRPQIVYSGDQQPDAAAEADLHHHAHEQCFIAQSIKTDVKVEPANPPN